MKGRERRRMRLQLAAPPKKRCGVGKQKKTGNWSIWRIKIR